MFSACFYDLMYINLWFEVLDVYFVQDNTMKYEIMKYV